VKNGLRGVPWPVLVVAAAVLVALAVTVWPHHHPADRSAAIQANVGADSCTISGYFIQSKLDGSKQTIYDCLMPSGSYKCVTENGGIDSDSTAVVRLLFANTLSGGKPTCIA
jgi:hypothetical protein